MNRPLALLVAGTFFMENLDATIIATAAPAIAGDLGVDPVDVNKSYRFEQGFTMELNLAGVSDELRDQFAGADKSGKGAR